MFRQDYEVDNHEFVRERVGGILKGGAHFAHDYPSSSKVKLKALFAGLRIAFRDFTFLAYSSSGVRDLYDHPDVTLTLQIQLRQHSVWFMAPFEHAVFGYFDAARVIKMLGDFSKVINCPARYVGQTGCFGRQELIYFSFRFGARISQAYVDSSADS